MRKEFQNWLWTYGSHEPLSMFLRGRRLWTAGLKGGSLWASKWHHDYDSRDNIRKMAELGMNVLLSRFYKGMGWDFEAADFPAVQQFARDCHAEGIKVLAYVQFGTLYFEVMRNEIPDLEDWAARDINGRPIPYVDDPVDYYRWMPCLTQEAFPAYLEKVLKIGIEQADFDGFLLDNCLGSACFCPRCVARFREYLADHYDPADFGLPNFRFAAPPSEAACAAAEWEDPVLIAWKNFQAELHCRFFRRLRDYVKRLAPEKLFTANVPAGRRFTAFRHWGQDYRQLLDCFDMVMDQNGNEPKLLDNGAVVSRVRSAMFAEALGKDVFVNTDGGAEPDAVYPETYAASIMDAKVFQSITTDRIIMTPERNGVPRWKLYPERVRLLKQYETVAERFDADFYAPNYAPVALLYSTVSQHLSTASFHALLSAEEVLLRRHIPYRLIVSDGGDFSVPQGCRQLLIFGAKCLSEAEISSVRRFAAAGGKVVADVMAGDCNEENRQYCINPFASMPGMTLVPELQCNVIDPDWRFEVLMPNNPEVITDNLIQLPFTIEAPETVYIRINRTEKEVIVHCINYTAKLCSGAKIVLPVVADARFVSFEKPEYIQLPAAKVLVLPEFTSWAMIKFSADELE